MDNNSFQENIPSPTSDQNEGQLKDRGREIRRTFSILGLGMVGFLLSSELTSLALALLLKSLPSHLAPSYFINMLISMTPMYLVGLPIFLLITHKLKIGRPTPNKLSPFALLSYIAVSAAFMYVGNVISVSLVSVFELIKGGSVVNKLSDTLMEGNVLVNILFVVILAPILEEIFFRKILCRKLLPYGDLVAITVPSAIFALCHGNFFQLFYAFLIGVILSYIYLRTGKLRYTIIIHTILNLIFGVLSSEISKFAAKLGEEAGDNIIAQLISTLLPMAYMGISLSIVALGVVAFVLNLKKIRLEPTPTDIKGSKPIKNIFLNVGVILTLIYFAYTMIYSVLI